MADNVQSFWATYVNPNGTVPKITDENVIRALNEFNPVLYDGWGGFITDFLRTTDWMIIRGLCWLADTISTIGTSVLEFLDFYAYQPVQNFVEQFYPFIIAASLVFFGIAWIAAMSKKEIPIVDLLKNGAFSWFTFIILPILMTVGVGFVENLSGAISSTTTPSSVVIKNNVWDFRAIDRAKWDKKAIYDEKVKGHGAPNFIEETKDSGGTLKVTWEELDYINPTEKLTKKGFFGLDKDSGLSDFGRKVATSKIEYGGMNGNAVAARKEKLVGLEKNFFEEPGSYYTIKWDGLAIILSFLAYILFALILQLRMVRIVTQIFLHWSVGQAISLSQWGTAKRNWEVLSKIGMGFVTLIFTQSLLTFFNLALAQLNDLLGSGKINFLAYILLLVGMGMEMIDGPVLWQSLFGIDAGLQSSWRSAQAGTMFLGNFLGNRLRSHRNKTASKGDKGKDGKKKDSTPPQPEQKTSTGSTPPPDGGAGGSGINAGVGVGAAGGVGGTPPPNGNGTQRPEQKGKGDKGDPGQKGNKGDKGDKDKQPEALDPKQAEESGGTPVNDNGIPFPEQHGSTPSDDANAGGTSTRPETKVSDTPLKKANEEQKGNQDQKGFNGFKKPETKAGDKQPFVDWNAPTHKESKVFQGTGEENQTPKPETRPETTPPSHTNSHLSNPFEISEDKKGLFKAPESKTQAPYEVPDDKGGGGFKTPDVRSSQPFEVPKEERKYFGFKEHWEEQDMSNPIMPETKGKD